ncbi:putative reverse transcriptase domain-containing protein [Tanacetum coccineum]
MVIRVVRDFPEEHRRLLDPQFNVLAFQKCEYCQNKLKELQEKGLFDQVTHHRENPCSLSRRKTLKKVQFLGHVVNRDGIHVDPSKVESVKNWKTPESPTKIRSFLGLASYYQRFIENFSKIAKPLNLLTQKNKTYVWGNEQDEDFRILKEKLCNAPVLALPDGPNDFVVYYDASKQGFGSVDDAAGQILLIGPEIVQETTEKIVQIKERLKTARSRQKSYADKRRKPLKFHVGDRVLLKVSPWKGVVRFGKKGKLAPRYVGPFEIVKCVGPVAYRLKLPQELSCVHDTFHVSNLKKCLAEPDVQVPLDEIEIDENLRFVEEPIEIVERDVKKLKR